MCGLSGNILKRNHRNFLTSNHLMPNRPLLKYSYFASGLQKTSAWYRSEDFRLSGFLTRNVTQYSIHSHKPDLLCLFLLPKNPLHDRQYWHNEPIHAESVQCGPQHPEVTRSHLLLIQSYPFLPLLPYLFMIHNHMLRPALYSRFSRQNLSSRANYNIIPSRLQNIFVSSRNDPIVSIKVTQ